MAERHVWIPMADGVRLAVSLFLPDTGDPCPVLLEALPYRKDDVTAGHRTEYERLASEHGYAVARVDLRETGSSEGVATDEYPPVRNGVGTLRLRPPGMTWNDKGRHPRATVTGRAGGDRLAATLPAP